MSNYFITYKSSGVDTYIELDATTSLSEVFGGSITSNPVADRTVVADTYINRNPKFSLSGIITDVTQPFKRVDRNTGNLSQEKSTKSRTQLIKSTLKNGTVVSLQSADEFYRNCVITSASFNKTSREGIGGWKVNLELTQINLVSALEITLDEAPIDTFSDEVKLKTDSSSNTTKKFDAIQLEAVGGSISGALGGAI